MCSKLGMVLFSTNTVPIMLPTRRNLLSLVLHRYALVMTEQIQKRIVDLYLKYEFHPIVSLLQIFCSEELGAFYLDILKDRLYTTAENSLA